MDLEKLRNNGWADAPVRWLKPASIEKRIIQETDVLIAASGIGPVGRPLWASPVIQNLSTLPILYSNFCKRFKAKSKEHAVYIDRILYGMRQSGEIWEFVNGTSIPNLDSAGLLRHQLAIPSDDVIRAFYDFIKPVYDKLYNQESRILATLRDALLPRLMSGEVRV